MSAAPLTPGTVFARDFKVVRALAAGGMGAVYVAEQLSTGQQRALKVMLPSLVLDPKLRERFEQEARVGSRFTSEHVVAVVAAGIDDETDAPWLAMELLRGEELSKLVARQGALPAPLVLDLAEQLCHAVGAAHAAGVVHRDLKPENVFVAESARAGGRSMVKVLDFGIAKILADASPNEGFGARPSADTAAIGSPLWMSPEQTARGGRIDASCDVWAVGLIVFHMLTGRFFWRAAEDPEATIGVLYNEICVAPIPSASDRANELGRANALPKQFDEWFAMSVNRHREHRFPNATKQLEALRGVLRDAPISKETARDPEPADHAPLNIQSTTAPLNVPADVSVNGPADANDRPKRSPALLYGAFAVALVALAGTAVGLNRKSEKAASTRASSAMVVASAPSPSPFASTSASASASASPSASASALASAAPPPPRPAPERPPPSHATIEITPAGKFDKVAAAKILRSVDLTPCRSPTGPTGEGWAAVDFDPNGRVTKVSITEPPYAGTAVGECVAQKLRTVKLKPLGPGYPEVPVMFVVQ